MSFRQINKKVLGIAFALAMIIGIGTMASTTAQAQYRGYNRGYEREDRGERDKGFRDGADRGREDARDHRRFDPNNSEHFRNGNRSYRDGFRRGYERGYREYARHGR